MLAYPYGEYNPEIQQLVRVLDYIGIAQHSGPVNANSDFTALTRFPFAGMAKMTVVRPKLLQIRIFLYEGAIYPNLFLIHLL